MGTAESSQSSETGGVVGLTSQSSFHRQSPNIARLIRSENSSKMEYEFPITEGPTGSSSHHQHGAIGSGSSSSKHTIIPGHPTRQSHSPTSEHPINHHTGYQLGYHDTNNPSKSSSNSTSNLWLSLTSCFGCRMRNSSSSAMNPLRDKVHAIRIVRASNDLTPAVFDSHYNIITLEQLRECDPNASGNANAVPNEFSNPSASPNATSSTASQNGNGSVASSSTAVAASKKDSSHRMRKKKKKRATKTKTTTGSDDDDEDDGSGRT